ncbi:hypothetical protein [Arthrobacter sp. NPDC080082]|uniref:hypothetical protein n=1 Tax=unclassified Arthrobacter TaxID=235627 RepID=UPI0034135686
MSDSDGMDDLVDGGLRQSLMIGSRIAETLARRRQESQRREEHAATQAAYEANARLTAERSAARAALAPVKKDQWWDKAQPRDIATAYTTAEAWKNHDPAALAAAEKIREEVLNRYGIDTSDVAMNAASLEVGLQSAATDSTRQDALARSQEEARAAAAEHEKAMSLLAAASIEDLRAQAAVLAPEMERHQVPVEYLATPELSAALQTAHAAKTPAAVEAADATVKERLYLIGRDGINGPDVDQFQGLKAESASAVGYGSAQHLGKFADSLESTGASETQIRGRLVAARSGGTHPSAAVTGKGAIKARKTRNGAGLGAERTRGGITR